MDSQAAFITHFVQKMGGSSQPFLAEASDGKRYVVKHPQENCASFLFNEAVAAGVYQLFGLLCPPWKPLILSDDFIDANIDCWIERSETKTRLTAGLVFGSEFLGDLKCQIYQILPGTWFKRLSQPFDFWRAWFLDICAEHYDSRQALFHERDDRLVQTWFIDNGFMFGGPDARTAIKVMAPRFLDGRIYGETPVKRLTEWVRAAQRLDHEVYWQILESIPDEWKSAKAISAFARFLTRLLDKDFAAVIIQRMDMINHAFLRLRSDGQPAWQGHCYGHYFPDDVEIHHDHANGRIFDQIVNK